ncbi:hypothetical protein QTQ03_28520 [Micromonospora sp. WMMA1363]|uniref:hypothetical protein n=1 Tax=Micromonospora sp. WMMA1363 TaxID=3053985 RepID=UPI00259D1D67|nr:hypothetical protein [Micromonospora sp. WMMA1363]MDM4723352.1 hypothetical protein [Micromonospora sp. WMMA1363]
MAMEARRERERRIRDLADTHAVALAMVQEVRDRADRQITEHRAAADRAVGELVELGERTDAVAALLGLSLADVRAARRRARAAADGAGPTVGVSDEETGEAGVRGMSGADEGV